MDTPEPMLTSRNGNTSESVMCGGFCGGFFMVGELPAVYTICHTQTYDCTHTHIHSHMHTLHSHYHVTLHSQTHTLCYRNKCGLTMFICKHFITNGLCQKATPIHKCSHFIDCVQKQPQSCKHTLLVVCGCGGVRVWWCEGVV